MKKIITLAICVITLFAVTSCGKNSGQQASIENQITNSEVYSFVTDGDYAATYYIVDFNNDCVFSFYADENDDTCFALPIEEGDLSSGLRGSISDGYSMIPFTMRYKEEKKTDRVIMTFEDAYDVELVATNLDEALAIKESKKIVELSLPEASEETDDGDVYTADGQVCHRDRIVGKEDRVDAIIKDIELGSGETISYAWCSSHQG